MPGLNRTPKIWRNVLAFLWNGIALVAIAVVVGVGVTTILFGPPEVKQDVSMVAEPQILEQLQHVNQQIFIQHYGSIDISYKEVPAGWISALRHIGVSQNYLLLVRGTVPAGFDLSEMSEDDIWVSADGRRAQVTLPPPQIFMDKVSIDFENSRILSQADRCPNFICNTDMHVLKDKIFPEARDQLIHAAYDHEILDQVAASGRLYYAGLLHNIGFDEVRVVIRGYAAAP